MATKVPATRTTRLRNASVRSWKIPGFDEPFVQDPLTFFEKNEFLALVARALEDGLAGGADLDAVLALLGMNEKQLGSLVSGKFDGDAVMISTSLFNVITRLVAAGPTLLEDLYLIALSIPIEKREQVRVGLRQIDDETGFGVLDAFVEQNTTTIRDFFPRWRDLLGTMAKKLQVPDTSPTSTD